MMRCCLKTLTQGLTDEEDIVTWKKEVYPSLVNEKIKLVSPKNQESYDVGDTIASSSDTSYNKYNIVVQKTTTTTERYRLKKVVNGIEVVPPEYATGIYNGETSVASEILNVDSYNINFEEIS